MHTKQVIFRNEEAINLKERGGGGSMGGFGGRKVKREMIFKNKREESILSLFKGLFILGIGAFYLVVSLYTTCMPGIVQI